MSPTSYQTAPPRTPILPYGAVGVNVVIELGCLPVLGESGSWHRAVGSTAVMVSKLVLDFSAKNI